MSAVVGQQKQRWINHRLTAHRMRDRGQSLNAIADICGSPSARSVVMLPRPKPLDVETEVDLECPGGLARCWDGCTHMMCGARRLPFLPSLRNFDHYQVLGSIRAHTTVVSGGAGLPTPPGHAVELVSAIQGCRHVHRCHGACWPT